MSPIHKYTHTRVLYCARGTLEINGCKGAAVQMGARAEEEVGGSTVWGTGCLGDKKGQMEWTWRVRGSLEGLD